MKKQTDEKPFDLKKIQAIIKKNWMVMRKDSIRLRMLLLFPLVMILIFGYTAGKSPTNIAGAIVDYDNSETSRLIISELEATNMFSIQHMFGSQDEGKKAIENGEVKILFVVPPGFEDNIKNGVTQPVSIIVDESDPTVAQMTRAFTSAFIQRISEEIKSRKMAAISQMAIGGQGMTTCPNPQFSADSGKTAMDGSAADASKTFRFTDAALGSTAQALKNTVGHVADPNLAVAQLQNSSDSGGGSMLLAVSAAKLQALDQVYYYQGLQAANQRLYKDTMLIYSDAAMIYQENLMQRQSLSNICMSLGSTGAVLGKISQIATEAQVDPVIILEIQPYGSGRKGLDFLIPSILALIVFQGAVMGMGRAIAGERRDGSLTRVFLTPTSNITIISGTLLFYIIFETIRSSLIVFAAMLIFGVTISGSIFSIIFVIAIYAAGATGLGMILSVMSKSQEQYMAIAMLLTLPTMFLAGVFLPIETMPSALQGVTRALPITYASDALRGIMIKGFELGQILPDLSFLAVFAATTLTLSVLLFKRELI
jgi:ABC-2 type transport system permease protein